MRKSILLSSALIAGSMSFSALADSPDWRYVEGGYALLDTDATEFDGAGVNAKYLLQNNIYLNGEYSNVTDNGFDINMATAGVGYRMPLNGNTDAYVGANFERIDTDAADENGYSVNTGVRSMVTQEVELMGEVGYYDVDDGDVTMKVGANYYFAPSWAAGVSYKKIDDIDMTQVTARYTF